MDDPFERPALVRRETLRRLEEREERYTEWFRPQDNTLKVSGASCTQVRDVFFSKLSRKERETALKEATPKDLENSILEIQARYLEKKDRWWSSDKTNTVVEGFVEFGDIFMQVVNQVLSSAPSDYGAAFAVVNLIYKGVKEKSDREERLSTYLKKMSAVIAQNDFYRQSINTSKMRDAFSAFCTGMIKFVIAADKYCTKMSIVKLILSSATSDPLQVYYDDIDKCVGTIENLRMAASLALLLEQRSKTEEITKVLVKMYEKATMHTTTPESTAILSLVRYKPHARTQKLTSLLHLPHFSPTAEKAFNDAQRIHLAPRDQWEYHPSLIQFPSWETITPRPLLWLSGPETSPGVSWVSSFSVDLIDAVEANESCVVVYMFCSSEVRDVDGDVECVTWTPFLVLKRLIKGVMETFPQICVDHVEMLSLSLFQEVGTSNSSFKAWNLLISILDFVQDVMVEQRQELYVIIDRLDLCISDEEGFGVKKDLIPRLQEMSMRWRNVRVVITSTVMARRVETLNEAESCLWDVWIDTGSAVDMDDVEYDD